ncbi:MAG: transcription termination/antitermination protein NusA [Desulfobacterales bacterium]|nr:transcription termination/antitermination protein NusA [Desulfobacterales bacterium]
MSISDIKRVVEQVSKDKGIDRTVLIKALEDALKSAARKKFGSRIDIEVKYNEETGEIEVFQFKEVVENITAPDLQIIFKEACKLDPECEIGDSLGTKMDTSTFGRIAAQSAKQVIIQKMKDAEKNAVYSGFINRKSEIINGIVQRIDRGNIIVNLGNTEGVLPEREQVSREVYRRGERIRAYILDVLHDSRGPQIILSRTHPGFLVSLFKTEVPEISEGIVKIMGAVREAGIRAKIAVASNDSDIDPVGACVGMKGSRVQNVVQELRGEKIDIVSWHIDPAKFVCNALSPAEISRVIIDEENRSMEVIVPDEFLSIAIGKKGQNVRLASKLTKWHIDVINETKYSHAMQDGYNSLVALPEISISLADALYEKGFFSAEEVSNASLEDLMQIRDITEEKAVKLLETAKEYVMNPVSSAEVSNEIASDNTLSDDNTSESIKSSVPDIQENTGADKSDEDAFSNAPLTDVEEK